MYYNILVIHSIMRWLVLISLLYAIIMAFRGYSFHHPFSKLDNSIRHWTATIAHFQLVIGITIYMKSPLVKFFWGSLKESKSQLEPAFFGWIHGSIMILAILVITIGSAVAKRNELDREKFKAMLLWYSVALILMIITIPWPFSPLANRPFFRVF
jgi:hypothetical protein